MLLLQPSSLTKAMRYFGIPARFSRLTAGLGESRRPSSMWIIFRTTSSPRGSTLLDSSPPSSAGDTLGMSFMAKYLPVSPPPAVSRVDPVSLSPPFHGGSRGSIRSFRPATQPFIHVPSRRVRSEGGRSQHDPESQEHNPSCSGRLKPSSDHGGALAPSTASLLCPSLPPWGMGGDTTLPQWGMGGDMTAAVVRPRHILKVRLAALRHIHRGPLPFPWRIHPLLVLRSSTGEDLILRH